MSATMTEEHVELGARQEALESRVLLLCPSLSYWKGQYQLPKKTTETLSAGVTVNKDDITTPRAKLVTDEYPTDRNGQSWKKRFQKIESRLESLKDRYSVPFPITGVRIVPKARGQELMDEMYGLTIGRLRKRIVRCRDQGLLDMAIMAQRQLDAALQREGAGAHPNTPVFDSSKPPDGQSIAYDLHVAATEFCNDWVRIRNQIAENNTVFEQIASKVPNLGSQMREKFALDVVPVELAGGLTRTDTLTQDDLAEHNDIVREACHRRVEEAIETMIQGPRQQLADALENLRELIARNGRVSTKTFDSVRTAIAKVRMFDFVANADLLRQIGTIEERLNITTPNSLDSVTAANTGFTAAIDDFMNEVQDAENQARDRDEFGRDFRAIDLD